MDRAAETVQTIRPYKPRPVELASTYFERVAQQTYDGFFIKLPGACAGLPGPPTRAAFLSPCVVNAAEVTVDTWVEMLRSLSPAAKAGIGLQ